MGLAELIYKKAFVKLLSGFGGVNGALLFRKGGGR